MQPPGEHSAAYERGYADGQRARRAAVAAEAERLDVVMTEVALAKQIPSAVMILQGARERLACPGAWVHGRLESALDAKDRRCDPTSPQAVRWDLHGAILAAGAEPGPGEGDYAWRCIRYEIRANNLDEVVDWHEAPERTVEDVLSLLDNAIARLTMLDAIVRGST